MLEPTPINYTLVSPSKVGAYAACTQRLVWDSDSPPVFKSSKWADFGTVCHYITQYKLGCAPPDAPTPEQIASAQTLVGSEEQLIRRTDECSDLAISQLPKLPHGVTWLAEVPAHDPNLLPERRSRKDPTRVEGFGGSIDLMASNRSIIVDLKFPTRPPDAFKIEYVWQLASYAMLTGVSKTLILWVMSTGKSYYSATIDWSDSRFASLLPRVRKFVERCGHKHFRDYVYPMAGDHCQYCDHKDRCPAKFIPEPQLGSIAPPQPDSDWLDSLVAKAAKKTTGRTEQLF